MSNFLVSIIDFINNTKVLEQLQAVDAAGLFTNGYFLVPFIAFVGYKLYKQAFNTLIITGLAIGLWLFSGSGYMHGLVVNGELQLSKVLPVAGVFLAALGVAIYFLFMRSD